MKQVKLYLGDNMESLKKLPDNSIDSIVTDAPYGLGKEQDMNIVLKDWLDKGYSEIKGKGFMGNVWDAYVPQPVFWKEAIRTLKPGGHTLCFFSSRTYDIGVMSMRLAGFEIRDTITWNFGSGFPKSHNIGKSYDKKVGNERELGESKGTYISKGGQLLGDNTRTERFESKGTSQWEGWGTALKPAAEYIVMARKPLSEKTIVANVIKWGVGGINIDGCRIKIDGVDDRSAGIRTGNFGDTELTPGGNGTEPYIPNEEGRFPANIIFDETAAAMLDEQSGVSGGGTKKKSGFRVGGNSENSVGLNGTKDAPDNYGDKGGASRFFYVPKVSKKERNMGLDGFEDKERHMNLSSIVSDSKEPAKNNHPTLKPINLMTYLCRLVTPPGGIVLDPFMGSGSTGIAACLEGFRFVGMELDEDYFKIAEARINSFEEYRKLLK